VNWAALFWMVMLLVANGFFVAAEFAYITARRNVLEQTPGRSAQVAVGLNKNLSLSLAAAQLGISMASLVLGYVAEPAVAGIFERLLGLALSEPVSHAIALIIALLIVVFLHMVIGEMAPKNIAISNPERSAVSLSLPFRGFIVVFRPLIALLNGMANGVLRLFGVPPTDALDAGHSAEDLAVIIATGRKEGVIEDFAHRLLTGAIIFGDLDASDVMVPRPDMEAAPADGSIAEIQKLMRVTGHSRIPIYREDLDDILGFVHVKDLMTVAGVDVEDKVDPRLIREALVVPETAPLRTIMAEMRKVRSHLGIVVDEHGSTAGLITLEDIAEELVGDISDEYDRRQQRVAVDQRGRIVAAGSVRPDELSRFGVDLPSGDYETIGGLIMDRLGRLPRRGDIVDEAGWQLRVLATEGRRVGEVEVISLGEKSGEKPGEG